MEKKSILLEELLVAGARVAAFMHMQEGALCQRNICYGLHPVIIVMVNNCIVG